MKTTPERPTNPEPTPASPAVTAEVPTNPTPEPVVPPVIPPLAPVPPAPVPTTHAALEIAQTCTLAGRTDLIVGFLEAGASPERVRHQLLAMQAEASPEIASRVPPVTPAYARPSVDPADNPLIQAVKRRLATH